MRMKSSTRVVRGLQIVGLLIGGAALAACSGSSSDAPKILDAETKKIQQLVHGRQSNFKDMGAAFKAISDELKAGRLDSTTAQYSIKSVAGFAPQIKHWFEAGTGPDSGLKMESKQLIWQQPEKFAAELAEFETRVAAMLLASQGGDTAKIKASFFKTAGGCKSCHDQYRQEN